MKASKNNRNISKAFQQIIATFRKLFNECAHSWWGFAEGVLQVVLFIVLWFKWSIKKHCVAKVLPAIWEIFWYENYRNYNFYRFSYKLAFILLLSFLTLQKQESGFEQIGGAVTRNIYFFCLKRVTLYVKAMLN